MKSAKISGNAISDLIGKGALLVTLLVPFDSMAFTSIASIKGNVDVAWWRASDYDSQKEADVAALEGCRSEARKNGIGKLAQKCVIVDRAKGPGYGAIVCGDNGCAWTTGYNDSQEAVDAAYDDCSRSYKNCQEKNISSWEDFAGFNRKKAAKPASPSGSCNPPAGKTLRYSDRCNNGDCVRTFENGCQKRFQAPYCYDALQGRWDWKPGGC